MLLVSAASKATPSTLEAVRPGQPKTHLHIGSCKNLWLVALEASGTFEHRDEPTPDEEQEEHGRLGNRAPAPYGCETPKNTDNQTNVH